jgi:hypothetical protein
MTVAYATPRDVYDLGLSARSYVVVPRPLAARSGDSLDFATGVFSMSGHGLAADDLARLVLIASGGALPGGASALTVYHPLPLDYWRFRLSLTEGGTAVTFTNGGTFAADGASSWGIQVDPERRLIRHLVSASADIDQDLTAHATPLLVDPVTGLYPAKVVSIVARIAARRAIASLLFETTAAKIATDRLLADEKRDDEQRAAWRLGQPIYPNPTDQTDGVPDNGARAQQRAFAAGGSAHNWVKGTL